MPSSALCVGINYFGSNQVLAGFATDAENMATVAHGMGIEEVTTLTDIKDHVTHDDIVGALRNMVANAQPGDDLLFSFSGKGAAGEGNFIEASDRAVTEAEVRDILATLPEGAKFTMAIDTSASDVAADIDLSCLDGTGSVVCIASGNTWQPTSGETGSTFTAALVSVLGENPGITWSDAAALADPSGNATVAATQTELIYTPAFSSDAAAHCADDVVDVVSGGGDVAPLLPHPDGGSGAPIVAPGFPQPPTISPGFPQPDGGDAAPVVAPGFPQPPNVAPGFPQPDGSAAASASATAAPQPGGPNVIVFGQEEGLSTQASNVQLNISTTTVTELDRDGNGVNETVVFRDTTSGVTITDVIGRSGQVDNRVYEFADGTRVAQADYNGDGVMDVSATYRNGKVIEARADNDLDGKIDYRMSTDANGIETNTTDMNEDGIAEFTSTRNEQDGVTIEKYDFEGDGKINTTVFRYADGATYTQHDITGGGVADLTTTYRDGKLVAGTLDTDGDGKLDTSVVLNPEDGKYYKFDDTDLDGTFETARGPGGAADDLASRIDGFAKYAYTDVGRVEPEAGPRFDALAGLSSQTERLHFDSFTSKVTRTDTDGDGFVETVVTRDDAAGVTVTERFGANGRTDNRTFEFDDGTVVRQADQNGDGVMDISATVRNNQTIESRADNDGDGLIDTRMDRANWIDTHTVDMNEDGIAEEIMTVNENDGYRVNRYDFEGDGITNLIVRHTARDGTQADYDLTGDGITDAATVYSNGKLVSGELDTNGDGVLDTVVVHNPDDGQYYVYEDTDGNGDYETARGPDTNGLANTLDSIAQYAYADVGRAETALGMEMDMDMDMA
ncbi:hypothetical protein H9P43_005706 [Blastocladiella emersonii ATCC 22665]|nr:hypothetical protein H9P43_005706 [Blastocladiella emersonii ATCC 22665]